MAESSNDDTGSPEQKGGAKTFTQEELNNIINERLKEEKERSSKNLKDAVAKALADEKEAQRISSLEGEEKLKATYEAQLQSAQTETKTISEELGKAKKELSIIKAEADLAKLGLPTEFAVNMIGEDSETTTKNIQAFNDAFNKAVAAKVDGSLAKGSPSTNESNQQEDWKAEIDRAMGIRKGGK